MVVGMPVYFHMYNVTDDVYKPIDGQEYAGGHAIECVGWGKEESGEGYWIMKNSWGCNWGDSGYFKQGWAYNPDSYFMGVKMDGNSSFMNDVPFNEQPQCQVPEDGNNADNCAQYNEFGDCKLCNQNYTLLDDASCLLDEIEIETDDEVIDDEDTNTDDNEEN
jgi:hypothetical protein